MNNKKSYLISGLIFSVLAGAWSIYVMLKDRSVEVAFNIISSEPSTYQIYYASPGEGFSKDRVLLGNAGGYFGPQAVRIFSSRPVISVRFDPRTFDGEFELTELVLSSRWGEQEIDLKDRMLDPNGVNQLRYAQGNTFVSEGNDPYVSITVPAEVNKIKVLDGVLFFLRYLLIGFVLGLIVMRVVKCDEAEEKSI